LLEQLLAFCRFSSALLLLLVPAFSFTLPLQDAVRNRSLTRSLLLQALLGSTLVPSAFRLLH
jgi:hypothetical protein